MRNRPRRLPSNNGMSDDEDADSDETPHGIQEFYSAAASFLSTPYMFNYPNLHHELNCVLPSLQFNVVERRTETPTKLL